MRTSALFGAKKFGLFEIYRVSARTRGEGVNFARFYADVFYGRPLKHQNEAFKKLASFWAQRWQNL